MVNSFSPLPRLRRFSAVSAHLSLQNLLRASTAKYGFPQHSHLFSISFLRRVYVAPF